MSTKTAKPTKVKAPSKPVENERATALKNIVNRHDFEGHKVVAQRVFSVVCECPIAQSADVPDEILKANIEKKMEFVHKVTEQDSHKARIRTLARILLSPVKEETEKKKQNPVEKLDPVLEIKSITVGELRKKALQLVLSQTARSRIGMDSVKEGSLSRKGSEIQKFFEEHVGDAFGCQTELVAKSVSAYIGEKISYDGTSDADRKNFENFFQFGLMMDINDGLMLVINGAEYGMDDDGDLREISIDFCRPATDKEVHEFIKKMSYEILWKIFSFLDLK